MIKPVELTNIEGTVITANAYKDADAIITILSEGRKLTFKACGAMKPTSKLHLATYIYSDVVLEIGGYKDHPEIKGVKLKKNRTDIYEDLKFMTALGIVQEIITNLVTEEDFIDDKFIEALLSFPKNTTTANFVFADFVVLLEILQNIGVFNKGFVCACCGNPLKDTKYYDMEQGGLICNDCADNLYIVPSDNMKMLILKTAMKIKPEQLYNRQPPLGKMLELFDEVIDYLYTSIGIKLKSYNNFKNWFLKF